MPTDEAMSFLLTGRAYAQLPNEVHLVFLKIDRRVSGMAEDGDDDDNDDLRAA